MALDLMQPRDIWTDFDFGVLSEPEFKEDSVREEIIAPFLRALGYRATGPNKVRRSLSLKHPYLQVGSRSRPLLQVPDYTLSVDDKTVLVLDAKGPDELVDDHRHIGQAYSYAVHPEVRCSHFALCNGKQFALFETYGLGPVFVFAMQEAPERWEEVSRYLSPTSLKEPFRRDFQPDLGAALLRVGFSVGDVFTFQSVRCQIIALYAKDKLTMSGNIGALDGTFMASFDFASTHLDAIVACLADPLREALLGQLSRAPFRVDIDMMLEVDVECRLQSETEGQHDSFYPLLVQNVVASRFVRDDYAQQSVESSGAVGPGLKVLFERLNGR